MGDIKQKECYRPNLKDLSKRVNKQEILLTHLENLELLGLKGMKLEASYKKSYLQKTSMKCKHQYICLRNKKTHKLETLECILKKTAMSL